MAPRRKSAAAPVDPIGSRLSGCAIALSGRFDAVEHSRSSMEQLIRKLGGTITKSLTKGTTHVVCSLADFNRGTALVAGAETNGLPVVNPTWIVESETQKTDASLHQWGSTDDDDTKSTQRKRENVGNGSTDVNDAADGDAENDDDQPKAKKAKTSKANTTSTAPAKVNCATHGQANGKDENANGDKQVAEGQFIKKKDVMIPVDEHCPNQSFQVYIDPDSGMIYDASMNQSNSTNNNNKFYRVQVVTDSTGSNFNTWTRWGRVGELGQSAMLGNGTLPDAIKNFEKKFRDKSGLPWDKRGDDPKPGKYAFVERSYNPDSDDEGDAADGKMGEEDDEEDDDYVPPKCTLEKPQQELMELIFNQQYFQNAMTSLNYDANKLPLGKLSKTTITRGFQQLKDLTALLDDPSLASSRWNLSLPAAIEHLSNTYYSVIPHAFGRDRPPIIRDKPLIKREIELLESLSDMKEAAELMKKDLKKVNRETVHTLDRQFQGLGLGEMTTLESSSNEYTMLKEYLLNSKGSTHHFDYEVEQIFRIERQGEADRFAQSKFAKLGSSDKRLLWHGSRCTNYGGILSQGLRIAPPEAPVSGYMFGKGIYLADMSSKSANYCAAYDSNGYALLLLCEAELGAPMNELLHASYTAGEDAASKGMVSTWGKGSMGPKKWIDAGAAHESLKGIKMPDMSCVGDTDTDMNHASLLYNEYICYDVAQVKLRYLFRVKM